MTPAEQLPVPPGMKIAQLSKASGLTRSTIHHYVNIGLLHRPRQVGLNVHLFDESHLNRLRKIRRLREKEGFPLARIRELLDRVEPKEACERSVDGRAVSPGPGSSAHRGERSGTSPQGHRNRETILDAAIELFSERGYERTKISDITEALHMGKGTFYVYFKNKKELFMECIDRLTVTMVPKEAWAEIRSEKDFDERTRKRGIAFLNAFPGFRGILNLLRAALGGRDPAMAQKGGEAFRTLAAPMARDLRRAIAEGVVKPDVNVDLLAYLELVMAEGIGYWRLMDPSCSVDEGMKTLTEMFGSGLRRAEPCATGSGEVEGPSGFLRDNRGVTVRIKHIRIEGLPHLTGRVGEGWAEVELACVSGMEVSQKDGRFVATARLSGGGAVDVLVDGETTLSGQAPFGSFRIPLKGIAHIRFDACTPPHTGTRFRADTASATSTPCRGASAMPCRSSSRPSRTR